MYKVLSEPKADSGHHTKRGRSLRSRNNVTDEGSAFGAAPIGIVVFPLCVVSRISLGLTKHFILEKYTFAYCIYTYML